MILENLPPAAGLLAARVRVGTALQRAALRPFARAGGPARLAPLALLLLQLGRPALVAPLDIRVDEGEDEEEDDEDETFDPEHQRVFILLTNRTHAHVLPFTNINAVRRQFHTLAIKALEKPSRG